MVVNNNNFIVIITNLLLQICCYLQPINYLDMANWSTYECDLIPNLILFQIFVFHLYLRKLVICFFLRTQKSKSCEIGSVLKKLPLIMKFHVKPFARCKWKTKFLSLRTFDFWLFWCRCPHPEFSFSLIQMNVISFSSLRLYFIFFVFGYLPVRKLKLTKS